MTRFSSSYPDRGFFPTIRRIGFSFYNLFLDRPVIDAVSPSFGSIDGGNEVTLTGKKLDSATSVTVNGVPSSFSVVDDTTITFTVPDADDAAGPVQVAVGSGTGSGSASYTYLVAPAALERWSPDTFDGIDTIKGVQGVMDLTLASSPNRPRVIPQGPWFSFPGNVGTNRIGIAHDERQQIPGDITILAWVLMDWAAGTSRQVMGKYGGTSAAQRGWNFFLNNSNRLGIQVSPDGTTEIAVTSDGPRVDDVAPASGGMWVKVEARLSDRRVQFFYSHQSPLLSPAVVTWTKLGDDRTLGAGWTGTHLNTDPVEIGRRTGNGYLFDGLVGRAQAYAGLQSEGSVDLRVDMNPRLAGETSFLDQATGAPVTVFRSDTGYRTAWGWPGALLQFEGSDEAAGTDNSDFDFGPADDFSLWSAVGNWSSTDGTVLNKGSTPGVSLARIFSVPAIVASDGTDFQVSGVIQALTTGRNFFGGSREAGVAATAWHNGTAGAPQTDNPSLDTTNTEPVRVGGPANAWSFDWHGSAFFARTLSPAQFAALSEEATPPTPPAFIPMEATGGTTEDVQVGEATWRQHTFTADDDFEITVVGTYGIIEYQIVGGGGGQDLAGFALGTIGTHPVVVGGTGQDSSALGVTATGAGGSEDGVVVLAYPITEGAPLPPPTPGPLDAPNTETMWVGHSE
jgi:hypothetical protein